MSFQAIESGHVHVRVTGTGTQKHVNRDAGGGSSLGGSGGSEPGGQSNRATNPKRGRSRSKVGSTGKQGRNGQIRFSHLEFSGEFGNDTQDNLSEDEWK